MQTAKSRAYPIHRAVQEAEYDQMNTSESIESRDIGFISNITPV